MKYFKDSELACPTTGIIQLQEGFDADLDELREDLWTPNMQLHQVVGQMRHNKWLQSRRVPSF